MLLAMEQPLKPGDMVARYRLKRPLGAGGMGSVWLAVQEGLGRQVALKVMHSAIALDAGMAARFRQEAEVAASFNHPGIVPVTDFGVDAGRPYLVMDFLEGESLDSILVREAPIAPSRVAFFGIQVLAALEAMHARDIVHRDLKPDNIFVSASSGVPDIARVLDFGIARVVQSDGDSKMTTTGQVLGTPAYMSPEQAKGLPVTAASDLYALGVVMYESLTGRAPYDAENYHQLLFKIVKGEPPALSELCPSVDPEFVRFVERAMAPDAADRFASATEMREALTPFAAMDVLRASTSQKTSGLSPKTNTDPLAATMTPQQVPPMAFDATVTPDSPNISASGAGSALQSVRPEPSRRRWVPFAALFALGVVGAVVFTDLQQPEASDETFAVRESLTTTSEQFPQNDERDEATLSMESENENEGATAEEQSEANDDTAPTDVLGDSTETNETSDEANDQTSDDSPPRTGAPPASHDEPSAMNAAPAATMNAAEMSAADMSAVMDTDTSSPQSVMRMCQQGEREMFLIRSPLSVYVSGGDPSGAGLRSEFFQRLRAENAAFSSCLRGKYMDRGQDVNVTFNARGAVTAVTLRPYCPMPAAVERCVAGIVRSIDFSDLNPTAGVAKFGLTIRGI